MSRKSRRPLVRQLGLGAATTLLSASFVLTIACSPGSSAGNSNEVVAAVASPTPPASASPQISQDNDNASRRASDNNNMAGGQRVTLNEQGISFILPTGWHRDDRPLPIRLRRGEGLFTWLGSHRTGIEINIGFAGNLSRSIEQETDAYYRTHRNAEDARLLEIDGVRGVHFLVDLEGWFLVDDERPHEGFEMALSRFIRWQGLRMHRGRRQYIIVELSAPVRNFNEHRSTLYGILNSIRFIRE